MKTKNFHLATQPMAESRMVVERERERGERERERERAFLLQSKWQQ
ncbi:MAG: hypothetical protein KatS3mg028_1119 [Bacteroidia bacterium]|nr:MAG: hypothetical protein KatS3mg028_1119 [Bacteroidia bacterium]